MAYYYDKDELKHKLELENIFDLLEEFGGNPMYTDLGIISDTICHNIPGTGSKKLYYYDNDGQGIFHCYTGCEHPSFDVFELVIKVKRIQENQEWELYDAMHFVAQYFGIKGTYKKEESNKLKDWSLFNRYNYDKQKKSIVELTQLPEYNPVILTKFCYPRILHWEDEGITPQVYRKHIVGYYPTTDQITIPHFDINNRLIGIRGRFLAEDDSNMYGKYRPLYANKQLYSHPLSMNLYNLNHSKHNIKRCGAAILFESEKACMQYASAVGEEDDISIACCGSNISSYQIRLLEELNVRELVLAFDRDFEQIGDKTFNQIKNKIINIKKKYNNKIHISAIFDRNKITPLKSSPIDKGLDVFQKLLNERITNF